MNEIDDLKKEKEGTGKDLEKAMRDFHIWKGKSEIDLYKKFEDQNVSNEDKDKAFLEFNNERIKRYEKDIIPLHQKLNDVDSKLDAAIKKQPQAPSPTPAPITQPNVQTATPAPITKSSVQTSEEKSREVEKKKADEDKAKPSISKTKEEQEEDTKSYTSESGEDGESGKSGKIGKSYTGGGYKGSLNGVSGKSAKDGAKAKPNK